MHQLDEPKLQMEALLLAVIQLVESSQHDLEEAREVFFRKQRGGARRPCPLVGRDLQQFRTFPVDARHERVAEVMDELPGKLRRAVSGIQQTVDLLDHGRGLALADGLQQPLKHGVGHRAHQLANLRGIEMGAAVFAWSRWRWPGP